MAKWLLRGLVLAALMVVVRLVQGALIDQFETSALLISIVLLLVFAAVVMVWGLRDGRADARRNPDPDRRDDLAMTWLLAGLVAGLLSGAVSWFISMIYPALYAGGLVSELTSFAAFTALLIFVPATLAGAVGRWLVDRTAPPYQRRREGEDERADTDVFAAVRDDRADAADSADGSEPLAQQSSVATLERDETAESVAAEQETEVIAAEERKDEERKD
ncbi:MAG: B-4DMT family transporter [Mycobacterium sp.]